MNVSAVWMVEVSRGREGERGSRRTDEEREPVCEEGAGEDDEEETDGENEGKQDDGYSR